MAHAIENVDPITVAETDNFVVWRNDEDGDAVYHLELGGVTLHFTSEEWDEVVVLIKSADKGV